MKKIISLLLAVMMIMSSFSVVMADDTAEEVAEVVITEDFKLMQTLGIFDDTILPDAPITRRQLAEIYVNIVLPEQGDDEFIPTAKYFDDITETDFDINMVYEMGIMGGAGDNKFLPDHNVTYAQFVKTVVDFLGYKLKAESYGGYPTGYQIMAIDFGFSKFAPSDINLLCTSNMVAAILREALGVRLNQIIYSTSVGDPVFSDDELNYLEAYRDINAAEGIITSTYVGDVLSNSKTEFFDIKVDDELYVLADDVIFLNSLLGNKIQYFYKTDAYGIKEIIYAQVVDTDIVEILSDQFDDANTTASVIYYYDDASKAKKISIEEADIFYNGEPCPSYDVNDINPFKVNDVDGFVRCVSVDGNDKDAEYVFVETFSTFFVSAVSNGQVTNKYQPDIIFKTDDFDENEIALRNIKGEHISSSLISPDDILNVFRDRSGRVKKVILTIDTHIGTIRSIKRDGDIITSINLDGLELKTAANLKTSSEYKDIKPGINVMAVFNYLGQIAEIEIGAYDSATFFGFITDAAKTSTLEDKYEIRLFTASGSFKELPLNEEVIFIREENSVRVESRVAPEAIINYLGAPVERQICRYTTNKNGEVSKLEFAVNSETTMAGEKGLFKHNIGTEQFNQYSFGFGEKATGYDAFFTAGTPLIMVPSEEERYNDAAYVIKDRNYLYSYWHNKSANSSYTVTLTDELGNPIIDEVTKQPKTETRLDEKMKVYGMDPNSAHVEIGVLEAGGSDSYANSYFLISGKSAEYLNGETRYVMSGYINKSAYTYEFTDEAYFSNANSSTGEYDIGDVIYIGRDVYNVIQRAELVFDASEWASAPSYATSSSYYPCDVTFIDKKVISYDKPATVEGGKPLKKSYIIEDARVYVYRENNRGVKSVTIGSVADIRALDPHGYATKMYVYDDSRVIWCMIEIEE